MTITGLPTGANAALTVTGPAGFSQTLSASQTLTNLTPGSYTITATTVVVSGDSYTPAPATQSAAVSASATPVAAAVAYTIATGRLTVTITGPPAGAIAAVTVTGPASFSQTLSASQTLTNLTPGSYTITAAPVAASGDSYAPAPATQSVAVSASATPVAAALAYTIATGRLTVTITGLPTGANAAVTVTGPAGFSQTLSASQTLTNLTPGSYTVVAASSSSADGTFTPTPGTQPLVVAAGSEAHAVINYVQTASTLNLTIDGVYLTQAVQSYSGAVPLLPGRSALLRVFVKANRANLATPVVRVRFYSAGGLSGTVRIAAGIPSVPTSIDESTLNSSWNMLVPASWVQPGMSVLADVDPDSLVVEANETDNQLPQTGIPRQLDVREPPPFGLRFVPLTQTVNGSTVTGLVSNANKDQYLVMTRRLMPLSAIDADVRQPYTTTADIVNGGYSAWLALLNELLALRIADASGRNYFGIFYTATGWGGMAYVPGSVAVANSGDPGGDQPGLVTAHELGHNWGRRHAPCGVSDPDPDYPYPDGIIGVYGFDSTSSSVIPRTSPDIMGYCGPKWIGDYTYLGILNYRAAYSAITQPALRAAQRVLLVWGRVRDGELELEPAFTIDAPAVLPERDGPYRIDGLDYNGGLLFSYSFDAQKVADGPTNTEAGFAFAIPLGADMGATLAELRFSIGARQAVRRASRLPGLAAPQEGGRPLAAAASRRGGLVQVNWDSRSYPMVMVRDASTGQVLSLARGGNVQLVTPATELDLVFSDGTRSYGRRVAVTPQ